MRMISGTADAVLLLLLPLAAAQYPPAKNCHGIMNRWCANNCPRVGVQGDGNPLLARMITWVGNSYRWGCFPNAELEAAPPPAYARLRGASTASYCANLSLPEHAAAQRDGPTMTLEQRALAKLLGSPLCRRKLAIGKAASRTRAAAAASGGPPYRPWWLTFIMPEEGISS